jgi:hypothetical protein
MKTLKEHALHLWQTTKKGYDEVYWLFYILGGGAIISKFFGLAGVAGTALTFICFYGAGRLHRHVTAS